jgi:hypothetical protein
MHSRCYAYCAAAKVFLARNSGNRPRSRPRAKRRSPPKLSTIGARAPFQKTKSVAMLKHDSWHVLSSRVTIICIPSSRPVLQAHKLVIIHHRTHSIAQADSLVKCFGSV